MSDLGEKGHVYYAYFDEDNMSEGIIDGPENTLKKEPEPVEIPFRVYWDRTNFKMPNKRVPMIWDMAPTILNIFGISTPADMRGKSII